MARRKRDSGERKPRRRAEPPPDPLQSMRANEGLLREMLAGLHGASGPPDTPLGRAQEVMSRAWRERTPAARARLAREALALSPDCADAYVLLAEQAVGHRERRRLYEQGVAAGERALGPEAFTRDAGRFWLVLETRPYLRARLGLTVLLWEAGRRAEAVGHMQDMLRLNPNDNQGARYTLAAWLLFLDRDDEAGRLLDQYAEDDRAAWAYNRALLAFRRGGDTPEARRLLQKALASNKHVPALLTGEQFPPPETPGWIGLGDESEAVGYASTALAPWRFTAGAVPWLREQSLPKPAPEPRPQGPLKMAKKWLVKHLPQQEEVWQADTRPMPGWLKEGGRPLRPWMVLVTSRSHDLVLAHEIAGKAPPAAALWDALVRAMREPMTRSPHRPAEVQVRSGGGWEVLATHLEEIGVRLTTADELDQLDSAWEGMRQHLYGGQGPGLLGIPGMTPARAAGFYAAAAAYFRAMPWKAVGTEAAVEVRWVGRDSGPWYAVPMGQSGLTLGLTLYDDLAVLRRQWAGGRGDRQNARETVATTVTFEEPWDVPVPDFTAAEEHGWEVAREDACPHVFHKERGMTARPPLVWELELLEGCLRAVPEFVRRRSEADPAREEMRVRAGEGEVTLTLGWVHGE